MGVQIGDACLSQDVAKNGEHLVCIQQPLILGKVVLDIELFDREWDKLRARDEGLHFVYWLPDFRDLPNLLDAFGVGGKNKWNLTCLFVFGNLSVFLLSLDGLALALESPKVQTKLFLHHKVFGPFFSQLGSYLIQFFVFVPAKL